MMRFLRTWLVPILAALMIIGIAISFVPLTKQAQARGESELTLLVNRAFVRVSEGRYLTQPVLDAAQESLLSKAVAVRRFLAHDDLLLATDALKTLCDQLSIDCIDVADAEGTLIASSDKEHIGLALGEEDAYEWAMAAADDESAELTKVDEDNPGALYACAGRTDIDGFVLLRRDDPYVAQALTNADTETLIADLPYGGDVLFSAESGGEDGAFVESDNFCFRKTEDGVTLIAARPLSEVYAARNAALLAFGAALVCVLICGIAAYLIRLDSVITIEEDEEPDGQKIGLLSDETFHQEEITEAEGEKPIRRSRKKKERKAEEETPEEPTETKDPPKEETAAETDEPSASGQAGPAGQQEPEDEAQLQKSRRGGRRKSRAALQEEARENAEDAFEKIVD